MASPVPPSPSRALPVTGDGDRGDRAAASRTRPRRNGGCARPSTRSAPTSRRCAPSWSTSSRSRSRRARAAGRSSSARSATPATRSRAGRSTPTASGWRTALPADGSALHAAVGDTVRKFLNALDRAYRAWPREPATAREAAADAVAALDDAILQAGYLTIPQRLDEKLATSTSASTSTSPRSSATSSPHPSSARRSCAGSASTRAAIKGLVDLQNGRIYRMSQTRRGRLGAGRRARVGAAAVGAGAVGGDRARRLVRPRGVAVDARPGA